MNKKKSAGLLALADIRDYLSSKLDIEQFDRFVVTTTLTFTKESRKLNKQLGLNSINHLGNTRGQRY